MSSATDGARELADGKLLLVFKPYATRVYDMRGRIVAQDDPSDATFDRDATFVPGTHRVLAIRAAGGGSQVFSLFEGKRFDLGLYEAGTTRVVHFDRVGVSYIFCNIHPEMSAVVLALKTPYYGISNAAGKIVLGPHFGLCCL